MPIYEFVCRNCKSELELLVRADEKPNCPNCNQSQLEKQLSVISTPAMAGKIQPAFESCSQPRCCGGGCQPM